MTVNDYESANLDPKEDIERVMRGGSWMCSENYCTNHRAGARSHATRAQRAGKGLASASTLAIMNDHAIDEQPKPGTRLKIVVAGS